MQISSSNSGSPHRAGLYPVLSPNARRPAEDVSTNPKEQGKVSTAGDARALQQVPPTVSATSADASRALVLARQRAEDAGLTGEVQTGSQGNEAAVQRALAAYNTVAGQEQRFELDEVLVGLDVFA